MTTKTWIGGTGSFDDPAEWSPGGVPGAGDLAIISTGTAVLRMAKLDGFDLQLQFPAGGLDISDVIFGRNFTLSAPAGAGGAATLNATGFNANNGLIEIGSTPSFPPNFSPPVTINMFDLSPSPGCGGAPAIFVNNGTIRDVDGQTFTIAAHAADAVLINNGTIDLASPTTRVDIGVSVLGSGTISTGESVAPAPSADLLTTVPTLEFGGKVGTGQTLDIVGSAYVVIDKPSQFHALIEGFAPLPSPTQPPPYWYDNFEPHLILENAPVTSYAVSHDVLTLWDGSAIVAQLRFTGYDYTKDNFLVTTSGTTTTIEPQGILAPMGVAAHTATAAHALG